MQSRSTRRGIPPTRRRWQFWFFLLGIFGGILNLQIPCIRRDSVLFGIPEFFIVPLGYFVLAVAVGATTVRRLQMPALVMLGIFVGDLLYLVAGEIVDDLPNLLLLTMLFSIIAAAAACYPGVLLGRLLHRGR
jgi:hypothetical protein